MGLGLEKRFLKIKRSLNSCGHDSVERIQGRCWREREWWLNEALGCSNGDGLECRSGGVGLLSEGREGPMQVDLVRVSGRFSLTDWIFSGQSSEG